MTPSQTSIALIRILEILALGGLAATEEIRLEVFWLAPLFAVLGFFLERNFSEKKNVLKDIFTEKRVALVALIALVLIGVFTWKSRWHPLIVAGHSIPFVHYLLWLGRRGIRNRTWRLGIAFINVVITASLSPDFYLAFVIFLFVILASMLITSHHLEMEFARHSPKLVQRRLPRGFFAYGFTLSFFVFLGSVLFFPILPKASKGISSGNWRSGSARLGYSEQVDLKQWSEIAGTGSGPTVMRIFLPDGIESTEIFPGGLIRARVLDQFNGGKWTYYPKKKVVRENQSSRDTVTKVEMMRDVLGTPFLPVPYGTSQIKMISDSMGEVPLRREEGEWFLRGSNYQRVHYEVTLQKYLGGMSEKGNPVPDPEQTLVPREWREIRGKWKELQEKLFKNTTTNYQKIQKVSDYFRKGGFEGSLNVLSSQERTILARMGKGKESIKEEIQRAKQNILLFLFEKKKGHCELFSSSAAILLRLADVPTRVITGFKLTRPPLGGQISIRQGDAHAWLEAWDSKRGWIALDPTPTQLSEQQNLWNYLREGKEVLAGYWYRYVLPSESNYAGFQKGFSVDLQRKVMEGLSFKNWDSESLSLWLALLSIFILLLFLGFVLRRYGSEKMYRIWSFFIKKGVPPMDRSSQLRSTLLKSDYYRIKKMWDQVSSPSEALQLSYQYWFSMFERLRFGRVGPQNEKWEEEHRLFKKLTRQLRTEITDLHTQ